MRRELEAIGRTVEEARQAAIEELGVASESEVEFEVIDEGSKGVFGLGLKFARVKARLVGEAALGAEESSEAAQESVLVAGANLESSAQVSKPSRRPRTPRSTAEPADFEPPAQASLPPPTRRVLPKVEPDAPQARILTQPQEILSSILELMNLEGTVTSREEAGTVWLDISGPEMGVLIGKQGRTLDSLQFMLSLMVNRRAEERTMIQVDVEGYRARREQTLKEMALRLARTAAEEQRRVFLDPMQPSERRIIHLALAEHPEVTTFSQGEEPMRKVVIVPRQP